MCLTRESSVHLKCLISLLSQLWMLSNRSSQKCKDTAHLIHALWLTNSAIKTSIFRAAGPNGTSYSFKSISTSFNHSVHIWCAKQHQQPRFVCVYVCVSIHSYTVNDINWKQHRYCIHMYSTVWSENFSMKQHVTVMSYYKHLA